MVRKRAERAIHLTASADDPGAMTTSAGTARPRSRRRGGSTVAAGALFASLLAAAPTVAASEPAPSGRIDAPSYALFVAQEPSGPIDAPVVPDDGGDERGHAIEGTVDAAAPAGAFTAPPATDFAIDFDVTVDAQTRQVVTAAAGIWSAVLDVAVPITVDVTMEPMGAGMLGAAGPVSGWYGLGAFPRADSLYPTALANQLAGRDLEPTRPDIAMTLATTMTWDKRIDGSLSGTGQPMLSVAVHELGHGLGHTSWIRQVDGRWSATFSRDGVTVATPYDRLVATGTGTPITDLAPADLAAAIVAPLRWNGAAGRSANGGTHPRIYSPPTFEVGSSIGHLDEATFGSGIMTPFLGRTEVHTSVPAVTTAMLADMGWRRQGTTTGTTTSTGSATVSTPTAAARATSFVRAVTTDFLRRDATTTEITRWRDHLLAGGSRADVTRAFAWSNEWIGVLVDGLYRSTLGRPADSGGRAFWIGVLRSGQTPAQVAAQFYASDEYYRRAGGTAIGWIADLYAEVLSRGADPSGLAFWIGRTAALPRSVIALDFYQSLESRRDRVEALFATLLGRAPDAGGWSYWAGVLSNGRDLDLATVLAASDEYFARAAQRFA